MSEFRTVAQNPNDMLLQGSLPTSGVGGTKPLYLNDSLEYEPDRYNNALENLAMGAGSVLAGAVDTFGTSLRLADEGFVENYFKGTQFGDFYSKNKDWAKTVADLGTFMIPGTAAMSLVKSGGMISKLGKGLGVSDRIMKLIVTSGDETGLVLNRIENEAVSYAKRTAQIDWSRATGPVEFRQAGRSLIGTKIADAIKSNIAFETGVFATMNQSDTLYPDDWHAIDYMVFNAALPLGAAGVEALFIRRQLGNIAEKAGVVGRNAAVGDTSPWTAVSRAGARDVSLTQTQHILSKIDDAENFGVTNSLDYKEIATLKSNLNAQRTPLLVERKNEIVAMGKDKPFTSVNQSFELSDAQINTVTAIIEKTPYTMLNVTSLEPLALNKERVAGVFTSAKKSALTSLDKNIAELRKKVNGADLYADVNDINKLSELRAERRELAGLTPVVFEKGGVVSARERAPIAQDFVNPTQEIRFMSAGNIENKRLVFTTADKEIRGMEINADDLTPTLPSSDKLTAAEAGEYYLGGVNVGKFADKNIPKIDPIDMSKMPTGFKLDDLASISQDTLTPEVLYRRLGTQNLQQRTALFMGYEKWVNHTVDLIKNGKLDKPVFIDYTKHYIYADVVDSLYSRLGEEAFSKYVALPSDAKISDIRFAALRGKFREFNLWQDIEKAKYRGSKKLVNELDFNPTNFRHYVNLPQTEPGIIDPILKAFMDLRMHGERDLKQGLENYENLKRLANTTAYVPEPIGLETLNAERRIMGHMLDYDAANNKAVVGVYRDIPQKSEQTYDALVQAASHSRMQQIAVMGNAGQKFGAEIMQSVFNLLADSATAREVAAIETLGNGSQLGNGVFTTRKLAGGDARALQAADLMDAQVTQFTNNFITNWFKSTEYSANASKLRSNSNALQNFGDYINARRSGWDVEGIPVGADGGVQFKLDLNSERNKRLWKAHYGDELPQEGDIFMPAPTLTTSEKPIYKPLLVKEDAFKMAASIEQLSQKIANETDALRAAAGKGPIQRRAWWVPTINLSNQNVSFIRHGVTGDLLYVASGANVAEMKQLEQRAVDAFSAMGTPVRAESPRETANIYEALDETFDKMINFADPLAQSGGITGKLGGPVVLSGGRALEDIQKSIESIFQSTFRRNRVLFFEPYVKQVRQMDEAIESSARTRGLNATTTKKWLNLIYGNPTLDPSQGVGKIYTGIQDTFDKMLGGLQEKIRPGSVAKPDQAKYESYRDYMGEAMPYSSAVDFAQRTVPIKVPLTMQKIASELNGVVTALTLRLFELGHPLLNMMSLGSTTPAVIKALQRGVNEDRDIWMKRVGPFGSSVSKDGSDAIFNPVRAMISGTHSYWNKYIEVDGKKIKLSKWAAEQGYFNQSVSDMLETMVKPHQSDLRRKIETATDFLSKPADASEKISRGIAFHTGWEIGEQGLGMKNHQDLAAFAHKFANDTVGDYRPNNRPQIFQGAVGMPLGLFTTFMWNYNERLFGYISNKNARAFYTQMGTQAALFGLNSVPGWSQFNNFFANNYDGTSNPVTGMQDRFGSGVTDWFMYGTISNLPKLFGAEDGVAFYQRGDAGLKMSPTIFNPQTAPAVQAITKVYDAFSKSISALRQNGVEPKQVAQIIAAHSISRPFKNAVELYTGYSKDQQERIISDDTRTTMGIISRLIGMKPMQETKNAEAWKQISSGRFARSDKLDELRDTVRYNAANGEYTGPEGGKKLANALRIYVENGGDPHGFAEFFRNNMIMSNFDRNTAEMTKLLSGNVTGKDLEDTKKLIWSQMPVTNQDITPK